MPKTLILPDGFSTVTVDEVYNLVPSTALFSIYYQDKNYAAFRKGNQFFPVRGTKEHVPIGRPKPICKVSKAQVIAIKLITSNEKSS